MTTFITCIKHYTTFNIYVPTSDDYVDKNCCKDKILFTSIHQSKGIERTLRNNEDFILELEEIEKECTEASMKHYELANKVSSSTSGLNIEVVNALPETPVENTIYIIV